jgi:protein-S-isoprenylcysteine O-methyltransferase Ste14
MVIMFPVLVYMYFRLAKSEEKEANAEFGKDYQEYSARVPAFIPKF